MNSKAYDIRNGDRPPELLFLCDHASNAVPEELDGLGLSASEFHRHIAYDIGARALTDALADGFGAPAITARWSRLVVDLNRGADDPTVVMKLSDGEIIPGNRRLDAGGVAERITRYHAPYHAAIAEIITRARAAGIVPALVSMHSFTPVFRGAARPWHVGILWDRDERLAKPLLEHFAREGDLVVGDNEPYSGALENDTLYRHGTMNGLPHVLIEIRQDLISDEAGVTQMAQRVKRALGEALGVMGKPAIRFSDPSGRMVHG
jgi:predicted N-formylglutamate amidohydrolase